MPMHCVFFFKAFALALFDKDMSIVCMHCNPGFWSAKNLELGTTVTMQCGTEQAACAVSGVWHMRCTHGQSV